MGADYNNGYDPNLLFKIRITFYWLAGVLITSQIAVDGNFFLYLTNSSLLVAILRSLMVFITLASFAYLCYLLYKLREDRKFLFSIFLFLALIPLRLINVSLESIYLFETDTSIVFQKYNLAFSIIASLFLIITFIVFYLTVQNVMKSVFNIVILAYSVIVAASRVFYHIVLYLDFIYNLKNNELLISAVGLNFVLPFVMSLLLAISFLIKASEIKNKLSRKVDVVVK